MTDIAVKDMPGRNAIGFYDPLEDCEPIYVLDQEDFPQDFNDIVDLLEQLGNDVAYYRDPA